MAEVSFYMGLIVLNLFYSKNFYSYSTDQLGLYLLMYKFLK